MSDNILKLIPINPEYIPDDRLISIIKDLISANIIDLSKVDIVVSDNVEFIDQGSNFNGITCPRCKSEIDMEWWQDSMGTASESNFESLNFLLPCCEEVCSLNDLEYDWPAGFAKFSIQISNLKGEVDSSIVQKLEDIISCRIRKVWAQY